MKIIATNLAKPTTVNWRGKQVQTGIYKYPVHAPITLQNENVATDTVIDRKHHGGEFKACYLFGADYYGYWKAIYPELNWQWGMFGENLTVEGLDENTIHIGNTYRVGNAVIQITEPRQPCFKLGIRFGDQGVLKQFIDYGHPGTYVRILTEGEVAKGDSFELIGQPESKVTVQEYNTLVNGKATDIDLIKKAIENDSIRVSKRELLKKKLDALK